MGLVVAGWGPFALEEGVLGLAGPACAPLINPLRSAGMADTAGEKAGEGGASRVLGSVRVISGNASTILTLALSVHSDYENHALSIVPTSQVFPNFCAGRGAVWDTSSESLYRK